MPSANCTRASAAVSRAVMARKNSFTVATTESRGVCDSARVAASNVLVAAIMIVRRPIWRSVGVVLPLGWHARRMWRGPASGARGWTLNPPSPKWKMVSALALQLIAIAHATVIDPAAGSIRPDMTVLVRGTRIEAAGASRSVRIPAGTRVIDATGKYVIPGLWDMHVHTDVPGGRALLGLFVANGVTGVRDMDGDIGHLRAFQRDIAAGSLSGPRMVVSGPYLAGQPVPLPHVLVRTPEEAVAGVDSLARIHVDFIKVHNGMPPAAYFAVAREARRRGMVFAGHVFPPVTPRQASDSGQRSLEHLSGFANTCAGDDSAVIAGGTGLQRFLLGACTRDDQGPTFARLATNHT